jgi:hypothetical protein
MASTTQETLFENFMAAVGGQLPAMETIANAGQEIAASLSTAARQAGDLQKQQTAVNPTAASPLTSAPAAASAQSDSSVGGTLLSIASSVFKSGLGLSPIISGLLGLFGGGGDAPTPPALTKYALPASIDFAAAYSGAGFTATDYDQAGMPRAFRTSNPGGAAQSGQDSGFDSRLAAEPPQAAAPQITVNVQAMDARSFLDRSSDIARAVRDAMLNLNAINDVVSEL